MSDWENWHLRWKLVCPLLLFNGCVTGTWRRGKQAAEELSPSAIAWSVVLVTTEKTDERLHMGYILHSSSKYTWYYGTSNSLLKVKNGNTHLFRLKNKYFLITWKLFCLFQSADEKNKKSISCRYFYLKIKIKSNQKKLALLICLFFQIFFSFMQLNFFGWSSKSLSVFILRR